jgi:hypothetical protein
MKPTRFSQTPSALLKGLSGRAKEVIERRFGLNGREPETLESIGRDFGITRERVRQIEYDALEKLRGKIQRKEVPLVENYYNDWLEHLRIHGGIRREDVFLADIAGAQREHVLFLLALQDTFERISESETLHAAWTCDKTALSAVEEFISAMVQNLKTGGRTLKDQEFFALSKKVATDIIPQQSSPRIIRSYLDLSKQIGRGLHGMWGLREWPEITPRGLRDRAYLVYKKEGRPLHFTEVARLIDAHGFTNGKKVLVQSVHNDLIRDPRFVLVGRGIYALKEWGYEPGIVREVIAEVLQKAGKPLSEKELIPRVLKQRQVKTSTILLNLQNKEYFTKTPDGKYTLAKTQETTLV